jgi:hypothetical protein
LETDDDAVWQLTLEALESGRAVKPMLVKCRAGGCLLARIGLTSGGPLFTSTWEVEVDPGYRVQVKGDDLGRRAARKALDALMPVAERSGKPVDYLERHGTITLLAVPVHLAQDYPDLLVRCRHGDAVLDRHEVIGWFRAGRPPKVDVSMPRRAYARPSRRGPTISTAREVRRIRTRKSAETDSPDSS